MSVLVLVLVLVMVVTATNIGAVMDTESQTGWDCNLPMDPALGNPDRQ